MGLGQFFEWVAAFRFYDPRRGVWSCVESGGRCGDVVGDGRQEPERRAFFAPLVYNTPGKIFDVFDFEFEPAPVRVARDACFQVQIQRGGVGSERFCESVGSGRDFVASHARGGPSLAKYIFFFVHETI